MDRSRPTRLLRRLRGLAPRGAGGLASAGLFALLVLLPGFVLWGAALTYRTGLAVQRATELSRIFERARYAMADEESLERLYRIEPSSQVRLRHQAVGEAMVEALRKAAASVAPADRLLIAEIVARHEMYLPAVHRLFAAVDAHDPAAAAIIDRTEVDPTYDEIEPLVFGLAERHRQHAAENLAALSVIQGRMLVATPAVFAIGAVLAACLWTTLRRLRRRAAEGALREAAATRVSERRLRGLVQNTSDMILICSRAGLVTYQTDGAERAWGHGADALLGQTLLTLAHPDDQPALRDVWEQLCPSSPATAVAPASPQTGPAAPDGPTRTTALRLRDGAGAWRAAELTATNLLDDDAVQGVVATIRDISQREAFEHQLTRQAFYDALTGLPNRVLFRDRLDQALVRAGRRRDCVGVLLLDLDKFKLVNDSLGHQCGDELLTQAAIRIRACVRAQDTVARLGSDEFVVILEMLGHDKDAVPVARAIAHQFNRPFMLGGREVVVTASLGIAISTVEQERADTLLRDADIAMNRAKHDGRAQYVVFDPSMTTDSLARLELVGDLRHALDHGELRVHYQPIVTMASGDYGEVEALVRWQHPVRGLVSPGDFIPAAEETGLIVPLGLWVLEEACRQVVAWHSQLGSASLLTLSVNLSPRQFQQPSLVADVARALASSGLPPHCLKLEITEGVIVQDSEATIRTLWELKGLGLKLAIDDFGTGYSSLSYLKRLPLDVLKIDRSFVAGIGQNNEDTAIVHAIMALARSLNLKVTGEGIETSEQASLLGDWGCDCGQGYLFSRPQDGHSTGAVLLAASARRQAGADAQAGDAQPGDAQAGEAGETQASELAA